MIVGVARSLLHNPTLDLLPKYAFGIFANTTEAIPNYPSLTRTTNLDGINDQSFTIDQFRNIRIDQVSIRNADGGFSQSGHRFDSNRIPLMKVNPSLFHQKHLIHQLMYHRQVRYKYLVVEELMHLIITLLHLIVVQKHLMKQVLLH